MAEYNSEKFYWLKLKRDFFKRHDIQVIEAMPNGKDYVLFYLKLMVESIDHNGYLRFSDAIPYDENMLAVITNTNVDVVRSAIKMLQQLEMIDILSDQTIYMTEVEALIGSQTAGAERRHIQRRNQQERLQGRQKGDKCHPEIEKDIEIDIKEKNIKEKLPLFHPPTIEEVSAYCKERKNKVNAEQFINFYQSKGWCVGNNKMKDWKACVRTWEQREDRTPSKTVDQNYTQRQYTDDEIADIVKNNENFDNMVI